MEPMTGIEPATSDWRSEVLPLNYNGRLQGALPYSRLASGKRGMDAGSKGVKAPLGAGGRARTPDLLITNQLLYQLSYTSIISHHAERQLRMALLVFPSRLR